MSREQPRNEEWEVYYSIHPEVLASWGEANGRRPNCECPRCLAAFGFTPCVGVGQPWVSTPGGAACPECGTLAFAVPPAPSLVGSHRPAAAARVWGPPSAQDGVDDVVRDL